MNTKKAEQKVTNRWFFAFYVGIFCGFIWGIVKIVQYYFKFTSIVIGFLVEPFYKHMYLTQWQGLLIGWGAFILFSIIASLIYVALFQHIKGTWLGMLYGGAWWCLLYLIIGPKVDMLEWISHYSWDTIITDFCLFVLWGLFIGYTIAVEFTNDRSRDTNPI
ncbi:hypothetical protein E0485_10605 [Paenibacillus albiflavus]|uniref:DUF1440 domain-containing protein n=1 Tax=Paenibacillus albiflavus TaxID=2545760 RepID=A0A4R4EDC1_9BACL|nr:YqhR family membrane protein [Paenibacillus albiflavus]TCZ77437.1 hypothetical protein E0485_10605 [Paenibacillus albiflavus]